jgi:hypothetical protein
MVCLGIYSKIDKIKFILTSILQVLFHEKKCFICILKDRHPSQLGEEWELRSNLAILFFPTNKNFNISVTMLKSIRDLFQHFHDDQNSRSTNTILGQTIPYIKLAVEMPFHFIIYI